MTTEVANIAPLSVSVEEAAEIIGVGRTHASELVASGAIASYKEGRRRLVPVSAIRDYVERRTADALAKKSA